MTGPVTTEALVEALNAAIELQRCLAPLDQIHWSAEDPSVCLRLFRETETRAVIDLMKAVRGFEDTASLAPLLAALQQATAERDAKADVLAEMKLCAEASAVEREGLLAELARLRAEGEAKDRALKLLLPFVDYAAGEGLMFVETEDGEHPEMDAADIVIAAAKEIGLELGSDASEAFLAASYDAIRAARAATAREGA